MHLEEKGDNDVGGVVDEADHVSLLILEGEGLGGLHSRPDHREDQHQQALLPAFWEALEPEEEDDGEVLEDGDEPSRASQGCPVHTTQVTKHYGDRAGDGGDGDQHEGGVHHVGGVLRLVGAKEEGGLDDEGDPGEDEAEGEQLEEATGFLEEDAGEERHTDWSYGGNHCDVGYGKIP